MDKPGVERLRQQLRKVSSRMRWIGFCSGVGTGSLVGLGFVLLWLSAERIWPIHRAALYAGLSLVLCAVAGGIKELLRPISPQLAARTMDHSHLGGEERQDAMVTALHYVDAEGYAADVQREQAIVYGQQYLEQLKRHLPFPRPRRSLLIAGCSAALAAAVLLLIPNPMDEVLERERQQQAWIDSQREEMDKKLEELDAQELDPMATAPLREELSELREELTAARQPEEALRHLEESMKRLEQLAERQALEQQERSAWLDAWKQQPELQNIARALEQNEAKQASQELDKLGQRLSELPDEAKERLADALSRLAEQVPQAGEDARQLAEALRQASGSLKEEQDSAARLAFSKLAAALEQELNAASAEALQAAASSAMASELARQGLELAAELSAAGLSVSEAWAAGGSAEQLADATARAQGANGEAGSAGDNEGLSGQGGGQGRADGQGSQGGQGGQGSQGQGSASGSGSGNSGEGSGSASGSGSGQGTVSGQAGSGSGQGSGAGFGSGGRALITTPRDSSGADGIEIDPGPATGGSVQKGGQGPVFDGASRPYQEVYSDYAAEAKRALDRGELPQSLQGLVERYFTEIDPGN